jgi:peptidoglycan/xylan/chitin deacetylase (PgdA/CDA1 family)
MLKSILRIFVLLLPLVLLAEQGFAQNAAEFSNDKYLQKLYRDSTYQNLRKKIISEYSTVKPGKWGEFVRGVIEDEKADLKSVILTFDACGGKNGDKYDRALIQYLKKEKISVTLFISGKWIDENFTDFMELSKETLFDIENHGLNHRPCSADGEIAYGIHGTSNPGEAFDEIEANAWKIRSLTGHYPHFYRSATTFVNESCASLAAELGVVTVSFHVLGGDAVAGTSASVIQENVIRNVKPGAIVLLHMNHPEHNTHLAITNIVPELKKKGYSFMRLSDFEKNISKK